ncbi:MAG: type II toxin-antitoxin system VapC family toxin, partial [Candidatus Bathyarchaeota archaeon]|nr:type II toxin-antitoxin system VapC family toxin [Candidatus Bathyarchaeota archaeon]
MARREEAVIDASVVIKWFSEEENTQNALKLREEHINGVRILSAPDLLIYEIANALRYKPGFDQQKIARAVTDLTDLQIDIVTPGKDLMERAVELAYIYDTTVYDSCYLALGE